MDIYLPRWKQAIDAYVDTHVDLCSLIKNSPKIQSLIMKNFRRQFLSNIAMTKSITWLILF